MHMHQSNTAHLLASRPSPPGFESAVGNDAAMRLLVLLKTAVMSLSIFAQLLSKNTQQLSIFLTEMYNGSVERFLKGWA